MDIQAGTVILQFQKWVLDIIGSSEKKKHCKLQRGIYVSNSDDSVGLNKESLVDCLERLAAFNNNMEHLEGYKEVVVKNRSVLKHGKAKLS